MRAPGGYWAFMPPALPPEIELTRGLVADLSAADRALGLLAGVGTRLPNPYLLITPFLRREAVLSSKIEGTQAGVSDVVVFEAWPGAGEGDGDVLEVANYVRALEMAFSRNGRAPLGLPLFCELHRVLMTGVRGQEGTPGQFRTEQNWIGPAGIAREDALYVPPPVTEMRAALEKLEHHLHAASDLPPLIRLALIHYQFEAIHPFLDGNGRVGRLLVSVLLREWDLLSQPMLYLSAFFERRRREYYAHLLAVSRRAAWEPWIRFFLTGVAEQAHDAVERANRLFDLRERYQRTLHDARVSSLPLRLLDELFMRPALSVAEAAKGLNVTRRAAQLNIDKLVEAGILHETTGRRRNRIYLAKEIVDLIERDLPKHTQAA